MSKAIEDSFCVLPWLHLNLNPDGAVTLCCQSHRPILDETGRSMNVQTPELGKVWRSEDFRRLRRRMLSGERLPHCQACFDDEAHGRESQRLKANAHWIGARPDLLEAIGATAEGEVSVSPLFFDLRLGNLCNLKCTACKPLYSSQIERDPVHASWVTDAPYRRLDHRFGGEAEWAEADRLRDEIIDLSADLMEIQLAGGEPSINKSQIALLKHLRQTGQCEKISLRVITNLSNVRDDFVGILENFKSVDFYVSIDGHGSIYEYTRYPSKWATIERNIQKIRTKWPQIGLLIMPVLQAVNAYNFVELFQWCRDEGLAVEPALGRGLDHYNDLRILPPTMIAKLADRFGAFYLAKTLSEREEREGRMVASLLQEAAASPFAPEVRADHMRNLMRFINDMDKSRRLSFRRAAPEMYEDMVASAGEWLQETRYA